VKERENSQQNNPLKCFVILTSSVSSFLRTSKFFTVAVLRVQCNPYVIRIIRSVMVEINVLLLHDVF